MRAVASSAPSCATPRPASTGTCASASWSTPLASGPTTCSGLRTRAASSRCARPRASISSCRATGSRRRPASSCAPRSRCCSSSRGATTGSSARPTTTGSTTRRIRPRASADIDYVLEQVNRVLAVPLTRADISGVYAGLRPLLSGEQEETSQLSREHAISRSPRGMVSVAGGKYTTYRVMARDAVDAAVRRARPARVARRVTDQIPLVGADGYHALANQAEILARDLGPAVVARRAPARPLRRTARRGARAGRRGPATARAGAGRRGVPHGRGPLRRDARGRAAPRRRARRGAPASRSRPRTAASSR